MENTEKKECKACKNSGINKTNWVMIVLAIYLLFASIYGTIQLFKNFL